MEMIVWTQNRDTQTTIRTQFSLFHSLTHAHTSQASESLARLVTMGMGDWERRYLNVRMPTACTVPAHTLDARAEGGEELDDSGAASPQKVCARFVGAVISRCVLRLPLLHLWLPVFGSVRA